MPCVTEGSRSRRNRAQEECEVEVGTTMMIGYTAPADKVCAEADKKALDDKCSAAGVSAADKQRMTDAIAIDKTYTRSKDIQVRIPPSHCTSALADRAVTRRTHACAGGPQRLQGIRVERQVQDVQG